MSPTTGRPGWISRPAHGGRAHRLGGGNQPDYSLDGTALVWTGGGNVWIRRRGVTSKVGPGFNRPVSDDESGIWGIVFGIEEGAGSGLWYRNNHTGNIDDLAYTTQGALEGIATSARANFVAFTAAESISPLLRATHSQVFFKQLVDGEAY